MAAVNAEIEAVAQAFYNLQDCARGWNQEPERLKAKFQSDAQAAIAALNWYRALEPSFCPKPDLSEATRPAATRAMVGEGISVGEECRPERVTPRIYAPGDPAFHICAQASATASRLTAYSREQIRHSRALIAQSRALLRSQQG